MHGMKRGKQLLMSKSKSECESAPEYKWSSISGVGLLFGVAQIRGIYITLTLTEQAYIRCPGFVGES